ncbi:hypothetical protein ACNPQM_26900 [Streptomyces sp. NPDC056231]|uniref:hypothetical protein n=1 Tax=Streptomyces sp. NPDC056231 TaxID=3345755 RepID=UPI003AAC949B
MWRRPGHGVLAALLVAAAAPRCAFESGGGPAVGHPGGSARRTQAAHAAAARKRGPATTPPAPARIAKSRGIKAAPLRAEGAAPDHMQWRERERAPQPGDIILAYFRGRKNWGGSMAGLVRAVMRTITDKGYALARLEGYV